jgi:hypothetical protein
MNPRLLLTFLFTATLAICLNAQPTAWKKFSSPQGAFVAEFPGDPKINETSNQNGQGFTVKVKMHLIQENGNVTYVLFNEMEPGVNILNDSIYLNEVTAQILERIGAEPTIVEDITFEGAPGKHFVIDFPDGVAEGKIILRTNRAYIIVSVFKHERSADRKRFLDSFHFLPYQKMASIPYQSKEHFFSINFPAVPRFSIERTEEGTELYAYYGMDPQSGNNYCVVVDKFSPYAQFESDSAVLANRENGYTLGADSIIVNKDVIVDGRPAKDIIIDQGENNFKMRVRVFTNGNYSYTMFTFLPYNEIQLPHVNQFFDSFRFTAKVPGNLLTDKSALMLKDIESTDTTILKEVMPAVEGYDFNETHVAKIQELLTKQFDDDADTLNSRKIMLLQSLAEIESKSSVDFIAKLFPTLKGNPELEFNALDVLARLNTLEANNLLLDLIPDHTPVKGNIWKYSQFFSYHRIDSAQSKSFLMRALPLLSRQEYKTAVYAYLQHALRNKVVQFGEVNNLKPMIQKDFESQFEIFSRDSIYQYLDDLTTLAGYDKPGKAELEILKKLSGGENDYLAIRANAALLRQVQKPNERRLTELAANRYLRKDLFSEFNDFNLGKHFPKSYYRQDSIALSEFYSYVADEYSEPAALKIVHSETLEYKGQTKKFYVLQFFDSEDGTSYRGVAGPYTPDKVEVFAELTGSYFEDDPEMNHHDYLIDYLNLP